MIADIKPYAEYKESGLPWLGPVPGHWELRKPRQIGSLLKGVGGTKEDALPAGVPCVRYGELYTTHAYFVRRPKTFIHADRVADYTPLHYGDVLFAASGETLEDIGRSAVNLIDGTAVCGGDVIILRPTVPVHAPFLGYVMDCRPMANQKATMGRGTTVKHIYPDELKHLLFPLPPVPEQAAIVRFLDWANGGLERAIRAKRKVIALLNEQKQAIIHRAVTRGLDPSAPLKPSGIPWLGDIPQHWGIVRNMALFAHRVESGVAGLPVFQVSLRSGITAEELDQFGRPKKLIADTTKYKRIYRGDIAYNTMRMWQGAVGVSPSDGLVSPAYVVLSPRGGTCPDFYDFVFHTDIYKQQVNRQSTGIVSDRNRLYWDSFKQMPNVGLPSSEQEAIVAFIYSQTSGLNAARARLEREIELLREYRTRLVADVVTGKLDVREAAARLPDEVPLDAVEDDTDPSLDSEAADEEAVV